LKDELYNENYQIDGNVTHSDKHESISNLNQETYWRSYVEQDHFHVATPKNCDLVEEFDPVLKLAVVRSLRELIDHVDS